MKVLIYGAGVIGCELAHELLRGNNDITLLARGAWKERIDKNGLVIRHYAQLHTTKDFIKTIDILKPDQEYDLIFVTMQYSQLPDVLPILAQNKSKYIIFIGNNMNAEACVKQLQEQSPRKKEAAFAFTSAGGRRESGKVVSIHFGLFMTIGGLREGLSEDFQSQIENVFAETGYKTTVEKEMESWLLCHMVFILPLCYLCYYLNGKLKKVTKQQIEQVFDAVAEAHVLLKSLGYSIRPDGEEEYFTEGRKKNVKMLHLMAKTPFGKLALGDHAIHAKGEMLELDRRFQEIREMAKVPMPAWDRIREEGVKRV